jgi:hypothetical protein
MLGLRGLHITVARGPLLMDYKVVWKYEESGVRCRLHVPSVLREWHRASMIGVGVAECSLEGRVLTQEQVSALNRFLNEGRSWSASRMPYFEALRALHAAVGVPVGKGGSEHFADAQGLLGLQWSKDV